MAAVAEQLTVLTRSAFLKWAASQVGTGESPRGSNRVPYWLNTKPEWNGSSWCAAFLQSGALTLGEDMRDDFGWGPYYVPQIAADAKAAGQWHTTNPQAGDWVVMGSGTKYSHIGVIEKVLRSGPAGSTQLVLQTIEGNTSYLNSGSQNNGDGVYRKRRTGAFVRGFVRIKYAPEPKPTPSKPTSTGPRQLHEGNKGPDVGRLQRELKRLFPAYAGKLAVDDSFGPKTDAAVREFQRRAGLKADGWVGPNTRAKLKSYGAKL